MCDFRYSNSIQGTYIMMIKNKQIVYWSKKKKKARRDILKTQKTEERSQGCCSFSEPSVQQEKNREQTEAIFSCYILTRCHNKQCNLYPLKSRTRKKLNTRVVNLIRPTRSRPESAECLSSESNPFSSPTFLSVICSLAMSDPQFHFQFTTAPDTRLNCCIW